jgi:hypothetical protein
LCGLHQLFAGRTIYSFQAIHFNYCLLVIKAHNFVIQIRQPCRNLKWTFPWKRKFPGRSRLAYRTKQINQVSWLESTSLCVTIIQALIRLSEPLARRANGLVGMPQASLKILVALVATCTRPGEFGLQILITGEDHLSPVH